MDTLAHIIRTLASLKINQLHLYTEHTFSWRGHETVWQHASPITPAEARELDALCKSLAIELVPCLNTLAHMERWLNLPEYAHLAATTGDWSFQTDDGRTIPRSGPFSLNPSDPRSIELIKDLLDQMLPCFSSNKVNIGCDEAFDIAPDDSRLDLYLDHVSRVCDLCRAHNKLPMMWGDMLMRHPAERWAHRLPKDTTLLLWGYEPDTPFADMASRAHAAGFDFLLCPGTSAWRSFTGRTTPRRENIVAATRAASQAQGLMTCNWGDLGCRQQLPIELLSIAHGAAAARNPDAPFNPSAAAQKLFNCAPLGPWIEALGDADALPRAALNLRNQSAFFYELHRTSDPPAPLETWHTTQANLAALESQLHNLAPSLDPLTHHELAHSLALAQLATEKSLSPTAPADRALLTARLRALVAEHRALWLTRSRLGGLDESCAYFPTSL